MSNNSSRITPNVPIFPNQTDPGQGCPTNSLAASKERDLQGKTGSRLHKVNSRKFAVHILHHV